MVQRAKDPKETAEMNPKKLTPPPLLAILAAAALIAGCGEDDEDAGTTAAQTIPTETLPDDETTAAADTLTEAEWIEQADAICQETDEQVGAVDQPRDLKDVARVADEIQALVAEELEQLRELAPPAEISADVGEMLSLQEVEAQQFDLVEEAAASGDQAAFEEAYEQSQEPGRESNRIAKQLGMEECEETYG